MRHLDTIIIGAGQAGLAMSHCLSGLGLDHVLLESGRVAERWRRGSWDSLSLLTPNWMTRMPGYAYRGDDPNGFMAAARFVRHLDSYAQAISAPIIPDARVEALEAAGEGYRAITRLGTFTARTVVIATGACGEPAVPAIADALPGIVQLTPASYRNPGLLPAGGALVVGASSSGVQIADEIHRSGRPVTIAVGRHTRLPRTYRGRDITWWLDLIGMLDERHDAVHDITAARRQPSLQLIGSPELRSLGLPELALAGVRVVGRLLGGDGHRLQLDMDSRSPVKSADEKMHRLLGRIDAHIIRHGLGRMVDAASRPTRWVPDEGPSTIDLRDEGIGTIVWATGYRRDYSWLKVPVLDAEGELRHDGGIVSRVGLYALGLRFMRRRKSSFIDGVGPDATELAAHLAAYLRHGVRIAA
jgi:putative flavoprotein involved in K+ transport